MEGKLGARNGADCSIDTASMPHTALTLRDALIQTFVIDSDLY